MINKKSIWFLTLFSLILVLSVYYITMPSELLLNNPSEEPVVEVSESTVLVALRVEKEEKLLKEINELKTILTNNETSIEEKNNAFDKIKELNIIKGEEEKLVNQIKEEFQLDSFVEINGDQVKVVINSKEHNTPLANKIMRKVQSNYETKMYVTVKFT